MDQLCSVLQLLLLSSSHRVMHKPYYQRLLPHEIQLTVEEAGGQTLSPQPQDHQF